MAAAATEEIAAYISMLREDGRELEQLVEDFLIHVTSFFRDAAAFRGQAWNGNSTCPWGEVVARVVSHV